jgi:hypothetical protein
MAPNGWIGFNCPACVHNGEPSNDTKKRMGLHLDPSGGMKFHCFRCGYVCSWFPGQSLNQKIKKLFGWLGGSHQEILQLNLECMRLKQDYKIERAAEEKLFVNNEVALPENSHPLEHWAAQDNLDSKFLQAVNYLVSRNPNLIHWFIDFQWSPEMPDHIIIPLRYNNQIYGWTARLTRPQKDKNEPKYYLMNESKFLFGAEVLDDPTKKYVLVTEGPLDAISIGGVAIMGNQITEKQMKWLNGTDKEIIVIADKDAGGQKLIDAAQNNGWGVSFPDTQGLKIKDPLDMVNHFGRLMAVKMIFDSVQTNHLKISMLRKNWN